MASRVSVVIVAYRSGPALGPCLDSLERQDSDLDVVVVDNGAVADEIAVAAERDGVSVVSPGAISASRPGATPVPGRRAATCSCS